VQTRRGHRHPSGPLRQSRKHHSRDIVSNLFASHYTRPTRDLKRARIVFSTIWGTDTAMAERQSVRVARPSCIMGLTSRSEPTRAYVLRDATRNRGANRGGMRMSLLRPGTAPTPGAAVPNGANPHVWRALKGRRLRSSLREVQLIARLVLVALCA